MTADIEHSTDPSKHLTDEVLQHCVETYIAAGGNRSEAARRLGVPRQTFNDRLKVAETRLGIRIGRIADGRIEPVQHEERSLPQAGSVARYIFTSVQNNTHLHPGWINIKAYSDWLDSLPGQTCEFVVGTYSYAIDAYGAKAVKRGSWKPSGDLWYAPEVHPYIKDERIELAPGLVWCGEMNILPTARNPLNGMETYNGRKSNIVPHAKIAMDSVASLRGEGTKFNWSTGTITQRNYVQKRVGIIAEQSHAYGALLVEVDSTGSWWARQLHLDGNGHLYDVGPSGVERGEGFGAVRVVDGQVHFDGKVDTIVWGDIHASEMEPWVRDTGWEPGGMLDALRPRRQVMHDVFSMRSRNHHEAKDFHAAFAKHVSGIESVESEVKLTAEFLRYAHRPHVQTIVVPSNHDRHLDRWLNESDPRKDPVNAEYHMTLQAKKLSDIRRGLRGSVMAWALLQKGAPDTTLFLEEDESYIICRDVDGGIEVSLHGDRGPNGSRGSTRGLTKLGRAAIKGHDHTAAIRDLVYSVGACSMDFSYMAGPTSHSISHCVVFENARRQIITMWEGKWRA